MKQVPEEQSARVIAANPLVAGLAAGEATTDLVIRRGHGLRVVGGLLSGIHASDSSHFALLEAFMHHPRRVLERSWLLNEVWGFDFVRNLAPGLIELFGWWRVRCGCLRPR